MPFDSTNFEPQDRILDALRALRAFHSDPAKWCSEKMLGAGGSMCIVYALCHVNERQSCGGTAEAMEYLKDALPPKAGHNLVRFNERMGTTHAELMAFYDRAIELRRAEVMQAAS